MKSEYLQSGPIKRTIFLRPLRELGLKRDILWNLLKLPYGHQITCSKSVVHQRNQNRNIILIAAKVTDDIVLAAQLDELHNFTTTISAKHEVRKSIIDDTI